MVTNVIGGFSNPVSNALAAGVGYAGNNNDELLRLVRRKNDARIESQRIASNEREGGDWLNPFYNPKHNDGGYHRFDTSGYGSGMQMARTYEQGGNIFRGYMKLNPGEPGYTIRQDALNNLRTFYGISDYRRASDRQLFEAMDAQQRGVQDKNTRPKRSFGVGDLAKIVAAAAATYFTGGAAAAAFGPTLGGTVAAGALAGAAGATTSGVLNNNLSLKGVGTGALMGGAGGYLKAVNPWAAPVIGDAQAINALGLNDSSALFNTGHFAGLGGKGASFIPAASNAWADGLTGLSRINPSSLFNTGNFKGLGGTGTTGEFVGSTPVNPARGLSKTYPGYSPQELYRSRALGEYPPTKKIPDSVKKIGIDAIKGLLAPDKPSAASSKLLAGSSGGGSPSRQFVGQGVPPPTSLPQYFNFGNNPFGGGRYG